MTRDAAPPLSAEDLGLGIKAVREAHRHCLSVNHGGHDFPDCPMYRDFLRLLDRRATDAPSLRAAVQAYLDWRDQRAAQWDAVAIHDHEHGMTPCPEWDELTNEPFDVDQRLDDRLRAALAEKGTT